VADIALQRHDLLRVEPVAWPRALERSAAAGEHAHALVREWASHRWPVMVRRYRPGDAPDLIPVAIALPPEAVKTGVALQLHADEVRERLAPIALRDCVEVAPRAWREALHALPGMVGDQPGMPSVFGSLLWQSVTGRSYLHEGSDLDLLWRVVDAAQARALAHSIQQCAATSPMRIDGEFVLADGAGVHWREWLDGSEEVIVKTLHRVESRRLSQLFPAGAVALPC
jgi:phosphoribosyl-dephospho-CoA transferase